ncbi:MarR family transcriptional regulator [Micromonospora sp. WP24]|uniref:MarR family transcriptional regulator n=1 Tax=Micromonospora sp. WP24 TaxID=2604469 RepID=UPI001CA370C6
MGLLTDQYLDLDRPLGPLRLLWEIGDRTAVRELRDRLGRDSGYLSRLLRALEDQGLVRVVPHPADRRAHRRRPSRTRSPRPEILCRGRRPARPTRSGRAERAGGRPASGPVAATGTRASAPAFRPG